jgi:hypothetical protein
MSVKIPGFGAVSIIEASYRLARPELTEVQIAGLVQQEVKMARLQEQGAELEGLYRFEFGRRKNA